MREYIRKFPAKFDEKGNCICPIPDCNKICQKFKNGNWRAYCDLHNSYSMLSFSWFSLYREKMIGNVCVKCGSKEKLELDHIRALVNGGGMWDKNNLQTLCNKCHKEKTKQDMKKRKGLNKTLIL